MTTPTNITLLSRAILQTTKAKNPGTEQVVLYQPGVGTTYSTMTRVWAGAFGEGLIENVREAYGSKYERKSRNVPIKFVGVWDTVGSLGIPDLYIFGVKASALDFILGKINQQFQFSDTDLHPMIENAFHAFLSLKCQD